jgi:hypothetical protein
VEILYVLQEPLDDVGTLSGEVTQRVEHGEACVGVSLKRDELDLSGYADVESVGCRMLSESKEPLAADGVLVDDSKRLSLASARAMLKDDEMEPSSRTGRQCELLLVCSVS